MRTRFILSASLLAITTACSTDSSSTAPNAVQDSQLTVAELDARRGNDQGGAVYVLSNDVNANAVLVYPRARDGRLGAPTSVPTGGKGTGRGLGNQYGLILDEEGEMLFGVDAGSDEISAFAVERGAVSQTARVASGGSQPISIAVHNHLLYVLNDGATANITGFRISERGRLTPLSGSTRARSAPAGAVDGAQISFSPDGRSLVVTEKAANLIVTYPVLPNGRTGSPIVQRSSGATPFGFDFTRNGTLIVSEAVGGVAGLSTVSSYTLGRNAALSLVSASVPDGQSAVCWITISSDGRTAYASNTASSNVSSYAVKRSGALELSEAVAGFTGAGSGPTDMALSDKDRFLYVRSGGTNTITIFETAIDGRLSLLETATGLPVGANGLAAR